jgi:hypothetical protein
VGFTVPQTIKLAKNEYVAKIEGTTVYNESFGQVYITIKNPNNFKSRVYGPYGSYVGEQTFTFEGYILGIHGNIGPSASRGVVRNLGVYQLAPVAESKWLGQPVSLFYEHPDMRFPPVVKISKVVIYHEDIVYSLQVEYQLLDGTTRVGDKNGKSLGNLTTIDLRDGEELIGLKGAVDHSNWSKGSINQLTFFSRKKNGSIVKYGPFGNKSGDEEMSVVGHILGFAGTLVLRPNLFSLRVYYYV